MKEFPLAIGESATFTKTISESDVYLFAGITGDLARNHVDEEYMKKSPYGKRIVHGARGIHVDDLVADHPERRGERHRRDAGVSWV